jgi:hypothetical protein
VCFLFISSIYLFFLVSFFGWENPLFCDVFHHNSSLVVYFFKKKLFTVKSVKIIQELVLTIHENRQVFTEGN